MKNKPDCVYLSNNDHQKTRTNKRKKTLETSLTLKVSPEVCNYNSNPDSIDFLIIKLIWGELTRNKLFQKNKKERERNGK